MRLSLRTFTSLVQGMAAASQSASQTPLDLSVGSTLRAILEANAAVGTWMQWLILQVLQTTRAATSVGGDLDSWMADFSLSRLSATNATGIVQFSRLTPTLAAFIPCGALVRTTDGTQSFVVTANGSNAFWSPSQNGYSLPAGVASATVPAMAQTAGTAGNVQAGTIGMLAAALPGIDSVSNPAGFVNGMDAESDTALRLRFQAYLASRSRATQSAVGYAIASIQQNLLYRIDENVDPSGAERIGNFVVTMDDGSGTPSDVLLAAAAAAIDAVRPLGSTFSVRPPVVVPVTVSMDLGLTGGADRNPVMARLATNVGSYIDALPIGARLPLTRVAQLAYDSDASVGSVANILLNGAAVDVAPPSSGVLKLTQLVVN